MSKHVTIGLSNKKRLISLVGILLTSGFIATSLISYYTTSDLYKKDLSECILPLTGDNIYSEIQRDIVELVLISSMMASDTFLIDWVLNGEKDASQIIRYLKNIEDEYHTVTSFLASEITWAFYHPKGILTTIEDSSHVWYHSLKNSDKKYLINFGIDDVNDDALTIFINYKVFDYRGNFIGVTGCGLTVENIKVLLDSYAKRFKRIIYFVNKQHEVVIAGNISPPTFKKTDEIPELKNLKFNQINCGFKSLAYNRDNQTFLLNTRYIKELGLYLFVEQSLKGANRRNIIMLVLKDLLITIAISVFIIWAIYSTINTYQKRLELLATTDNLTRLTNRHAFEILFTQTLFEAKRKNRPLTLIIFDIDLFKKVNDTYGHQAGDIVLQTVASTAKEQLRETDSLCRWGGEEFLLLLRECNLKHGFDIAEKLRRTLEETAIHTDQAKIRITISLGLAQYGLGEDPEHLINRADQALYRAKNNGRNRVETAE